MKKGLFLMIFFMMILVISTKQVFVYSQKTIYIRNNYILSAGAENVAYVTIDVNTVTKLGKTNFRSRGL